MTKVLIEHTVGIFATLGGLVLQSKQDTNFVEAHVQGAAAPYEGQSLNVLNIVDAIVRGRARGLGQESFPFIVADGLHLGAGEVGKIADFHWTPLCLMKSSGLSLRGVGRDGCQRF